MTPESLQGMNQDETRSYLLKCKKAINRALANDNVHPVQEREDIELAIVYAKLALRELRKDKVKS